MEDNQSGWGATIGIIILVVVFLIGGVYFFMREHERLNTPPIQETINT